MPTFSGLPGKQDWTVADLEGLPEELGYELIDGRLLLLDRPPVYQIPARSVLRALDRSCPGNLCPVHRVSLMVDEANQPCPDGVVLRPQNMFDSPVPAGDAMLVFDVIPPRSRFRDMFAKTKVYAEAGVTDYWILDPFEPAGFTMMVFQPGPGGRFDLVECTHDIFTTDVPFPVTIDLPALTADWNETWERIRSRV